MENIINIGEIIGALLLGAAIGGIVAAALEFIFALDKGNETRKNFSFRRPPIRPSEINVESIDIMRAAIL